MRKEYVEDGLYDSYYLGQVGSGGAAFADTRYQRGDGLVGIFRGLFRAATPLLKRGAMAIRSGGGVAKDVASGKNVKQALRHRGKQGLGEMIDRSVTNRMQTLIHHTRSRPIKRKRKSHSVISHKRRRPNDIVVHKDSCPCAKS